MTIEKLRGKFDLVLVTYDTIVASYKKYQLDIDKLCLMVDPEDERHKTMEPRLHSGPQHDLPALGVLHGTAWHRIIFDESHHIANPKTRGYAAAVSLCAERRWGYTGTPFKNTPLDKWAQLRAIGYTEGEASYATDWGKNGTKPAHVQRIWFEEKLHEVFLEITMKSAGIKVLLVLSVLSIFFPANAL